MTKDEALKLALEFIENSECGTADLEARIKKALAQPEQEPTKAMIDAAERINWSDSDVRGNIVNMWQAMCAAAPPSPQRTWVGLTDEERKNIMIECESTGDWAWELKAAQAIEAKLKEKNTRQDGDCKHCVNGCPACDARRQSNVLP